INPFPPIRTEFEKASPLPNQQYLTVMKVNTSSANLRQMPSTSSDVISSLSLNTLVFVLAGTSNWYQIKTSTGQAGFIYKSLLSAPSTIPLERSTAYAYKRPLNFNVDSLFVQLDQFTKIGEIEDFEMIIDRDENIFYLPSPK